MQQKAVARRMDVKDTLERGLFVVSQGSHLPGIFIPTVDQEKQLLPLNIASSATTYNPHTPSLSLLDASVVRPGQPV